ncbi:MAG: tRNA pseudouridine(55) synthase TruB, partial [Candidatus Firestonebacteria bacterium]|nr:tRNA pseudouridine(55) synthase TruB [Candidatus Firestonebacteria bacterium]
MLINGILAVNKPQGVSSFDVVKKIRKITCNKVGHTGTLDPIATGLLIVCIGEATKIVPYILDSDKEYIATMCLGKTTDTQDRTGELLTSVNVESIPAEELEKTLDKFRGEIEQITPMYSAVHYKGERLYNLARRQKEAVFL